MKVGNEEKSIDYILTEIVGGNGIAQWKIIFFGFILNAAGGIPLLIHMFAAHTPDHRCQVPICEGIGNETSWMEFALPKSGGSSSFLKPMSKYDSCSVYQVKDTAAGCVKDNFDTDSVVKCNEWVYDQSEYDFTLATKFNLVCEDEYKNRLLGSLMMVGLMFGSLMGGKISDAIGRKKACYLSVSLIAPSVIFAGYSPSYFIYATLRLISCTCIPIQWVGAKSLLIEVFGLKGRERCVAVKDTFAPIYMAYLGMLAYFIRDYHYLHLANGITCFASLLTWFFIPESIRWDIANNRKDRAMETLLKIAKDNKRELTEAQIGNIDAILTQIQVDNANLANEGKHQIWDMFKGDQLKISIILIFNWITVCLSGYTLTLNVTTLNGNIFLNFVLSGLAELPASLMIYFLLKLIGRRYNLCLYQFITVICCIVMGSLPKTMSTLVLIIFLVGKASAGAAFEIAWLLPMELYPTNLRAQAVGTCSTIARFFGILASFIGALAYYWQALPLIVIGVPTLIAGLLATRLPETSGKGLPQTIKK